jgi:flagellar protein FlaJ
MMIITRLLLQLIGRKAKKKDKDKEEKKEKSTSIIKNIANINTIKNTISTFILSRLLQHYRIYLLLFLMLLLWIAFTSGNLPFMLITLVITFFIAFPNMLKRKEMKIILKGTDILARKGVTIISKSLEKKEKERKKITTTPTTTTAIPFLSNIVDKLHAMQKVKELEDSLYSRIDKEVKDKELIMDARKVARTAIKLALLTAVIVVPIIAILAVMMRSPLPLVGLTAVAIMYYKPILSLKSQRSSQRTFIDNEYPFFIIFASILSNIGKSLFDAFQYISVDGKPVFKYMSVKANKVIRDVILFNTGIDNAIRSLALRIESQEFGNILLGYLSIVFTGGNVTNYLELKAIEGMNAIRFKLDKYKQMASTYAELLIIVLVIFPSVAVMGVFLKMEGINLISIIMMPVLGILLILMVDRSQLKEYTAYEYNMKSVMFAVLTVFIGFGVDFTLTHPINALKYSLLLGALVYALMNLKNRIKYNEQIEKELPFFLRDLTEKRKIGLELARIIELYEPMSREFRELMVTIKGRLSLGFSLFDACKDLIFNEKLPWLLRYILFLLAKVDESGMAKVTALEQLTQHISKFIELKQEVKSSVKMYEFLTYATPIMLAFIIVSSNAIMLNISNMKIGSGVDTSNLPSSAVGSSNLFQQSTASETDVLVGDLFVVIASIVTALVMTKIANLTITNTRPLVITVILALLILILKDIGLLGSLIQIRPM